MSKRRVLGEMLGAELTEAPLRTDIKKMRAEVVAAGDVYLKSLESLFNAMDRVVTKKRGGYQPEHDAIKKLRDQRYPVWNKAMPPYEQKVGRMVDKIEKMSEKK